MNSVRRIKKLDEDVINKIAAGEIIQRPANAVKELLENCLDASSTQIIISIKQGGLSLIQIQDNGSGIEKDDFPILCERFTTSKLQEFNDLLKIETFGFRGEALASITHVANVQIMSKTVNSLCSFKGEFRDGKLVNVLQPCAGNPGTMIRVENLFYNVPIRKESLKSHREEYSKIVDVVSSYAALNSDKCSITLKRVDDNFNSSPDVRIVAGTEMENCIVELYDSNLSNQLLKINISDDKYGFSVSGYISKPNYNSRKFLFILFINKRLVNCALLKKTLENLYGNLLPKRTYPFIFLHLMVPSKNIDVNVHPTKFEVHFLHEELIVSSIHDHIEKLISSSFESRNFPIRNICSTPAKSLLNSSFFSSTSKSGKQSLNSSFSSSISTIRPSEQIRVDPKQNKIDSFFNPDLKSSASCVNESMTTVNSPKLPKLSTDIGTSKYAEVVSDHKRKENDYSEIQIPVNTTAVETLVKAEDSKIVSEHTASKLPTVLSVIDALRQTIDSSNLCDWKSFVYVGMIDHDRVLIQRGTNLLLLNTPVVNYNLFYQLCLYHFGNFGEISLLDQNSSTNEINRTLLKDLFDYGLTESRELTQSLDSDNSLQILLDNAEFLKEYFSIHIDVDEKTLLSIPLVLDKFIPDLRRLPKFVINLCTKIVWNDEKSRINGICREIAEFYAFGIGSKTSLFADNEEFEFIFEHTILPMYKSFLRLPLSFEQDGMLIKLTSLPELYKVFERC